MNEKLPLPCVAKAYLGAMFYLHHTPWWLRMLFPPNLTWQGPAPVGNEVYLTFDDGPHETATPWVLQTLAEAGMQGTFFCIGKNVVAHPQLYQRILQEGHAVGNHTMNHQNARHTPPHAYLSSVQQACGQIQSHLFRPPYGQFPAKHARLMQQQLPQLQPVMWSVITGDFDTQKNGQQCFEAVKRHTGPGSILVFHDSAKAFDRLKVALPLTLQWLQQQGLQSKALPESF